MAFFVATSKDLDRVTRGRSHGKQVILINLLLQHIDMETLWFVARTIACAEINMRNFLQKCNIECFVPTKIELIKKKDSVKEKEIPLINNLIFFKTDYSTANSLFINMVEKYFVFVIRKD